MGYVSTALIGYEIDIGGCYQIIQTPSCPHDPPEDARFCPTCGIRVGKTYRRGIQEKNFQEFVNHLPVNIVFEYVENDETCWIGYGCKSNYDNHNFVPLKSYEEIENHLLEILKPWIDHKLIKLKNFGLWSLFIGH